MKRKKRKLSELPVRCCYTLHKCCVCKKPIIDGQHYFDGGVRRRIHIDCVSREDIFHSQRKNTRT